MKRSFLILLFFLTSMTDVSQCQSSILINEDRPSLIDTVLQIVWEPSSLIRFWTSLDQLYNIGLSWRTAAKTLLMLPFDHGRSMSHVRIQEPRGARTLINVHNRHSNANHLERFNSVYSKSSTNPDAASTETFRHQVQPPPFLLQAHQNMLSNPGWLAYLTHNNFPRLQKDMQHFPQISPDYLELLNREIMRESEASRLLEQNIMMKNTIKMPNLQNVATNFHPQSSVHFPATVPLPFAFGGTANSVPNPEARLRMVIKLLKDLGERHKSKVIFDDDLKYKEMVGGIR